MSSALSIRLARLEDDAVLRALIPRSARALSDGFYSPEQAEAAITYVFGVDRTLIEDGSYLVAERGGAVCGCGGWSARRTLYGGDQHKAAASRRPPRYDPLQEAVQNPIEASIQAPIQDSMLDPRTDAARIRAFFVAPEFARQGVGAALLQACASAAFMAGFRQLELLATLPGVPFYATFGFSARQEVSETVPGGVVIPFVRMWRPLDAPNL